jgi:hypothetical protein
VKPQDKTVEPPFELKPQGGFDELRKELGVMLKGNAHSHVGVVIDADEEVDDQGLSCRWCTIRLLLRSRGYTCPEKPNSTGIILEQEDRPRVGIWVMPDNLLKGKVETFVMSLVPPGNQLWSWAEAALASVPDCAERFDEKDRHKALVHTYLAVQKQPGSPMGAGIRASYFSAGIGLGPQFAAWVKLLFEL